jgi:hypothetical protein
MAHTANFGTSHSNTEYPLKLKCNRNYRQSLLIPNHLHINGLFAFLKTNFVRRTRFLYLAEKGERAVQKYEVIQSKLQKSMRALKNNVIFHVYTGTVLMFTSN